MTASAHPSPGLIASYAAGEMPLAPALAISAHIETCPGCRDRARAIEAAEGQLMASLPGAALAEDAFEQTLARLNRAAPARVRSVRAVLGDVVLPRAVAAVGVGPRRFLSPDFWVAPVRTTSGAGWRAYVLRAPAGAKIPHHLHRGPEYVQVLKGAFHDGRTYAAGEFADSPAGEAHELRVADTGPCACLIAAQGGAKWRGVAGAISPLLGV